MTIRPPGQNGPRITPKDFRAKPSLGCDRPDDEAVIGREDRRFEIVACHSSRDGFAAITLRDPQTGALLRVQKVPFEHRYDEDPAGQCRRIREAASGIVRAMAAAMDGDDADA